MPAYKYFLKNGRVKWYATFYYTDWTGEQCRKLKRGFLRKSDAEAYEREFLTKYASDPTITFAALVDNYLEDMNERLKPTTMGTKINIIQTKLVPFFGKMKINEIDEGKIRKWQNELIRYRNENGEEFSQTYLRTINNQMSSIMNYAVKYYKLRSNPCHAAGYMGKNKAGEMNIWTQNRFEEVMQYETKSIYQLLFRLLFYSGIRSGEILALTPEDICRDEAAIDINKNYAVVDQIEYFLTPKTERSIRKVTIPPSLHADLLEYIDSIYIEPEERIFYFRRTAISKELQIVMTKAGIEKDSEEWLRVHDLRHSHASMLIHMKKDIGEISRRLGHDSYKTTWDTYSHLYPGTDRALADEIDELIASDNEQRNITESESEEFKMITGSPFSRKSQYILNKALQETNPMIHRNNQRIFEKYGIDIDSEQILGYSFSAFVDYVACGDTVFELLTAFRPNEKMRDLMISLFTEAVTTCELANGSIEDLDSYITNTILPRYSRIYSTQYDA